MLTARRVLSIPLFIAGGLLLLAGYGGGIAAAIYYEIQSWKLIIDGDIVEGIIVGSVVLMLAVTLVNLLNIPGIAFVGGASRLWGGGRERSSVALDSYPRHEYEYDDGSYGEPSYLRESSEHGHVRDKPHECPHCSKQMVTLNGLDQHLAAKHPEL